MQVFEKINKIFNQRYVYLRRRVAQEEKPVAKVVGVTISVMLMVLVMRTVHTKPSQGIVKKEKSDIVETMNLLDHLGCSLIKKKNYR